MADSFRVLTNIIAKNPIVHYIFIDKLAGAAEFYERLNDAEASVLLLDKMVWESKFYYRIRWCWCQSFIPGYVRGVWIITGAIYS